MWMKKSVVRFSEQKWLEGRKIFYEWTDFSIWPDGSQKILSKELWEMMSCNVTSPSVQYGLTSFEWIIGYGVEKDKAHKISIVRLDDHVDRIFHSVNRLNTRIDYTKEQIREAIVRAAQQHRGAEKIYFRPTSRTDQINYGIDVSKMPFQEFLVAAGPFDYLQTGLKLTTAPGEDLEKLSTGAGYLDAKITWQYANGAKGKWFANRAGCNDALLCHKGNILELSGANVIGFKGDSYVATPSSKHIFAGLTRDIVIQLLKIEKNICVQEMDISLDAALKNFDSWCAVGTAAEIKDIKEIDGVTFSPSPLSQWVQKAYQDIVRGNTQHYKGHELYQTRITVV